MRAAACVPFLLLAFAGCVRTGELDLIPPPREAPSVLPNFPGDAADVYPVLLIHGFNADPRLAPSLLCPLALLDPPFYRAPPVDNRDPYLHGRCDRSSDAASLWEAKVFQNRTQFEAQRSDAFILHGYASQSQSGSSRCCLLGDHAYKERPFRFMMGGRNYTVDVLDGASFRVSGDGIDPHVLGPGRLVEYDLLLPSPKGNDLYQLRFENPGTWPRTGLKHPREEWTSCAEPRGYLCHVSWGGLPPPEIWKPGKVVPRVDDVIVRLNASQPTLAGLLEPLLKLPGWDHANLTRLQLRFEDGELVDLWTRVRTSWGEVNVTRATDHPRSSPPNHAHSRSSAPGFYVRVANETGPPHDPFGEVAPTLHRFDGLNFTQMRAYAEVGPDVTVRVEQGPAYSYAWANEVVQRTRSVPPHPHVWVYAEEPLDEAAWRRIHEPSASPEPTAVNLIVRSLSTPGGQATFHVSESEVPLA